MTCCLSLASLSRLVYTVDFPTPRCLRGRESALRRSRFRAKREHRTRVEVCGQAKTRSLRQSHHPKGGRVWEAGFRVYGWVQGLGYGSGFGDEGSGFRVEGSGLRFSAEGSGLSVEGSGLSADGSGFRVEALSWGPGFRE